MKNFIVISLSLFLLTACSSSGDDSRQTYTFSDKETALQVFNSSRISCSGPCHESAGGLTHYSSRGRSSYVVGVCSLTYIGNNQVLTNKHCVDNDLQYAGANCKDRIKMYFPAAQGKPAESFMCDKVLSVSPLSVSGSNNVDRPDWAILTFSGSTRRSASPVNREDGLLPKQKVHAYSVFYSLDSSGDIIKVTGQMRKNSCELSLKDQGNSKYYFDAFAYIWETGENCTEAIIKGNSGSGLFNEQNQLVGVLNLGITRSGVNLRKTGGSNIACISHFGNPHPHCQYLASNSRFNSFIESIWKNALIVYGEAEQATTNPSHELSVLSQNYINGIFETDSAHNIDIHDLTLTTVSSDSVNQIETSLIDLQRQRLLDVSALPLKCVHKHQVENRNELTVLFKSKRKRRTDEENRHSYDVLPVKTQLAHTSDLLLMKIQKSTSNAVRSDYSSFQELFDFCESGALLSGRFCDLLQDKALELKEKDIHHYSSVNAHRILEQFSADELVLKIPYCQ